jgi:hypothetical protein
MGWAPPEEHTAATKLQAIFRRYSTQRAVARLGGRAAAARRMQHDDGWIARLLGGDGCLPVDGGGGEPPTLMASIMTSIWPAAEDRQVHRVAPSRSAHAPLPPPPPPPPASPPCARIHSFLRGRRAPAYCAHHQPWPPQQSRASSPESASSSPRATSPTAVSPAPGTGPSSGGGGGGDAAAWARCWAHVAGRCLRH